MTKILTAFIEEIDDVSAAVAEICEQIEPEKNFSKNSVGIISCYSEFLDSGVVAAISEKLGIPIAGTTTLSGASGDRFGNFSLSLFVITSDSAKFSLGLTEPLSLENIDENIERTYKAAASGEKAKLALVFAPLIFNISGDRYISAFDKASGGVPVFGTTAVDHNDDYHEAAVIFGKEKYNDRFAFILISGDIDPKFFVATISDENIYEQTAVITASEGNILKEIDGQPLMKYFESVGLAKNGEIRGINALPFFIGFGDGAKPIVRAMFAITPDGFAVCGGDMPVGASISVGTYDKEDVLVHTRLVSEKAKTAANKGIVAFSCIGRCLSLGADSDAELTGVTETISGGVPYVLSYSGGEFCPVYTAHGESTNRFHNNTFIACAF